MKIISKETARTINGGALYRCIWCGYTSNSYWRTYANALACVTRRFGGSVWRVVSSIV